MRISHILKANRGLGLGPLKVALGGMLFASAVSLFGQASPSAYETGGHLNVGVAISGFDSDWNGPLVGPALWIDWKPAIGPSLVKGLGIEVEGRDLNYDRSVPKLREDTAAAGVIYTWRHFAKLSPYGKFLVGLGSIDFPNLSPTYSHDTRTVSAIGGGAEYRLLGRLWARGEYEYQIWPDYLHGHALTPYGLSAGVVYHFGRFGSLR